MANGIKEHASSSDHFQGSVSIDQTLGVTGTSEFTGASTFNAVTYHTQKEAKSFVIEKNSTFPATTPSIVEGRLFFYTGSADAGKGLCVYKGGTGGDYPSVTNYAGWYKVGKDVVWVLSHSDLEDLSADDHVHYALIDGTRNFSGTVGGLDAEHDSDFVTFSQLKAMASSFKIINVTAKTQGNVDITLTDAGTVIDGVTLAQNNLLLLNDQTTASQNGVWLVNANGSPLTRYSSADSWEEYIGQLVIVNSGTVSKDQIWLSTVLAGGILGTTAINYTLFPVVVNYAASNYAVPSAPTGTKTSYLPYKTKTAGNEFKFRPLFALATSPIQIAAEANDAQEISLDQSKISPITIGAATKRVYLFPDIILAANTSRNIANLHGHDDVIVQIRRVSETDIIDCDVMVTDANITIKSATELQVNAWSVTVIG